MKRYIIAIICLSLVIACGGGEEHQCDDDHDHDHGHKNEHKTDHNKSNIHMNKASFEELVERFENPEREVWQKLDTIIAQFGDLSEKTVGDIGAGTGYFDFEVAKLAKNVIAIDADERFIKFIEDKKAKNKVENLEARLVVYSDPMLTEGELDVLAIISTYHHINDRIAYMKKCYKGMAEGATLLIIDFKKKETPHGPPVSHRLTDSELKAELEEAGFRNVEVDKNTLENQYIIRAEK